MKKFLFLAIAATAFASCSQDEVLEVAQKQAISFGTSFVDKSTRAATDPSYIKGTEGHEIEKVDVWGTVTAAPTGSTPVLIYNSTDVTRDSKEYGVAWTCPVTQYWVPGATYKFVGIVDGEKNSVTNVNIPSGQLLPTTVTYKADGETDLLCDVVDVAGSVVTAEYSDIVKFEYKHLLAKVKFTLIDNSPAEQFRYSVSDIEITNAYAQGTVDVANGTWSSLQTTGAANETYNTFGNIAHDDTDNECAAEKLLLPMSNPVVSFKLKLEGLNSAKTFVEISTEPIEKTVTIDLKAANAYNFNIEVGVGQEIKFSVDKLEGWPTTKEETIKL